MSNARGQRLFDLGDGLIRKALGLERGGVDARRVRQRAVADRIGLDLGNIGFAVAERAQCGGHRLVDDLEVAAAGELLEFDQREIRLDAGGVAIHHEADGAGRRHDGGLGIAIAVLFAQRSAASQPACARDDVGLRAGGVVERHRADGQPLVASAVTMRRAAVVADHAQHVRGVLLVAGEGRRVRRPSRPRWRRRRRS